MCLLDTLSWEYESNFNHGVTSDPALPYPPQVHLLYDPYEGKAVVTHGHYCLFRFLYVNLFGHRSLTRLFHPFRFCLQMAVSQQDCLE